MRQEPSTASRINHEPDDAGRDRRSSDRRRAVAEAVIYLRSRRIEIPEDEPSEAIIRLLAAVGDFEEAVHARGGALMIEGSPTRGGARTRFMLPSRRDDESILEFAGRISDLAERLGGGSG